MRCSRLASPIQTSSGSPRPPTYMSDAQVCGETRDRCAGFGPPDGVVNRLVHGCQELMAEPGVLALVRVQGGLPEAHGVLLLAARWRLMAASRWATSIGLVR